MKNVGKAEVIHVKVPTNRHQDPNPALPIEAEVVGKKGIVTESVIKIFSDLKISPVEYVKNLESGLVAYIEKKYFPLFHDDEKKRQQILEIVGSTVMLISLAYENAYDLGIPIHRVEDGQQA